MLWISQNQKQKNNFDFQLNNFDIVELISNNKEITQNYQITKKFTDH